MTSAADAGTPQDLRGGAIEAAASGADAEERLRLFIEHAPLALAMFDKNMRYLHVSRRWRTDYGLGDRDLHGLSHYEVFPEIGDEWKTVHARALRGETLQADGDRFVRADGTVQWIRWEVLPWRDASGAVAGILIFTEDITPMTVAARKARETAEWLELALRSAGAGAWEWNLHTNESVWSRELWQLYGLDAAATPASYDAWLRTILPEDRARAARTMGEAAARGDDIVLEFRVRWPDGSVHTLLSRAHAIRNGDGQPAKYLGIVMDVSEQKRAEELLHVHERERAVRDVLHRSEEAARVMAERVRSAVESIEDGFVLFDDDDRLVLCNEVYRAFLRSTIPTVEPGTTYEELLRAWSVEVSQDADERARYVARRMEQRKKDPTMPFEVRTLSGRILRISNRRTPEGGVVSIIRDLTDDEEQADELRRARANAEAGSAAKTEFLASMSHELRTPLNAILGFAQLLERDRKDPLIERHHARVDHILRSGEHLLRLIDDVLDLSRIDAGRVSISIEPVNVAEVLAHVKRSIASVEARHGIEVVVEPAAADLPDVAADRTRYSQILINFCSNALKYNRVGGGVRVFVSRPTADRVRVTVEDTGMGIPAPKQALLFHPFQRAGQETGPIEGTGIGLVITRRLATMMGGDVDFASVEGEGSSFWVDLPIASESTRQRSRPPLPSSGTRRAPSERLVLYVEDNPANVAFMQDALGSLENVRLLTAATAELGVEIARSKRPQAIIMDVNLEGNLTGIDAMRMLRASDAADIPVLALTAAASEQEREAGLEEGFRAYLTKPVNVDELIAHVEALLTSAPG